MTKGYIYALTSPKTPHIKIGMSERLPPLRLSEINKSIAYGQFAPWHIHDFIHVNDIRTSETYFHRSLREFLVRDIPNTKELFRITASQATQLFEDSPSEFFVGAAKLQRLSLDLGLKAYLRRLFHVSGLDLMLDLQGYWTLSLYPSTAGGRLFTLNIGKHEVAYAVDPRGEEKTTFVLGVDKLIGLRLPRHWADLIPSGLLYTSASERLKMISFRSSTERAANYLAQEDVRRAIVAYWMDHLIRSRENGAVSLHARHHNSNAVREIMKSPFTA
ncbi:GIY-YIG nuclease family protein [Pseudodonghicola xiamenensis]|uniref:Bacteriophage T5 Orf172 DNA-binding domain-containing protein n=1 Tax=Pseudodonghicola xiamenensis TaxID=337702 RepID=A0A8J3H8I9_9RHOB|nr:GIY-YIG nuclease family protein [Pseudodonghicola xiamenensis]GHH00367.1 hypothetical protein GCM10010961_37030 [Pseudodonghicola xiamenensis]